MSPIRRVTIREVAQEAGVSVATVSKVINDRYGVASETSARVKQVIRDLSYEASLVARSLRNQHTNVIGVLVADFEPFSIEVLRGVADGIRATGFELLVYSAGGRVDEHVGWERRTRGDCNSTHQQCSHRRIAGGHPNPVSSRGTRRGRRITSAHPGRGLGDEDHLAAGLPVIDRPVCLQYAVRLDGVAER